MADKIYNLSIPNDVCKVNVMIAKDSRLSQIYKFLMTYNGESGYNLVLDSGNQEEATKVIGSFVDNPSTYDSSRVNALVFEDSNGNIESVFYCSADGSLKWDGEPPKMEKPTISKESINLICSKIRNIALCVNQLFEAIEDIERTENIDINDVSGFCGKYIFNDDLQSVCYSAFDWAESIEGGSR